MTPDLDVFSYIYKLRQIPNEFPREKILRPIRAFPRPHRHQPQCHPPFSHGVLIASPSFLIASTAWDRGRGQRDAGTSASARQRCTLGAACCGLAKDAHGCSWGRRETVDARRKLAATNGKICYIGIDLLGYVGLAGLDSAKTPSHARNRASFVGKGRARARGKAGGLVRDQQIAKRRELSWRGCITEDSGSAAGGSGRGVTNVWWVWPEWFLQSQQSTNKMICIPPTTQLPIRLY
jgi:hypothetical protein